MPWQRSPYSCYLEKQQQTVHSEGHEVRSRHEWGHPANQQMNKLIVTTRQDSVYLQRLIPKPQGPLHSSAYLTLYHKQRSTFAYTPSLSLEIESSSPGRLSSSNIIVCLCVWVGGDQKLYLMSLPQVISHTYYFQRSLSSTWHCASQLLTIWKPQATVDTNKDHHLYDLKLYNWPLNSIIKW